MIRKLIWNVIVFTGLTCFHAFAASYDIQSGAHIGLVLMDSTNHLHTLFKDAANGSNTNVTYIVSGDSTRNNDFNFMINYYKTQFAKANVKVVNDASSGLDAKDWNANARSYACLQHAIDNTSGTGENTIMEYSLGINDQGRGASRAEQKSRYMQGITNYLAAKPNATVILVVPVAHGSSANNDELKGIYNEIATELNLILVDSLCVTTNVYGDSDYYQDATHPNQWGSRRVVNYIMDQIVPPELYSVITLEEAPYAQTTNDQELAVGYEVGYYSDSTGHWGTPSSYSNAWRLKEIPVEPNFVLKIKTGANRNEAFFMKEDGTCDYKKYLGALGNQSYFEVVIPPDGVLLRLTLAIDENSYDPATDDISVKYDINKVNFMSIDDINKGFNCRLQIQKKPFLMYVL